MHEVLVNRLGGLSLPRKSVVRLTDRLDMTLDVYRGRKTTKQQQKQQNLQDRFERMVIIHLCLSFLIFFIHIFAYGNYRKYMNDLKGTSGTGFCDS